MSLRERFEVDDRQTRRMTPWRLPLPSIEFDERESGATKLHGFDDQREYLMSVRCGVTFWANSAQLPQARKTAERLLMDTLYRDLLFRLSALENLITCGDQSEALESVIAIRKEFLTP